MGPDHSSAWIASVVAFVALFSSVIRFTQADINVNEPNYHPWSPEGGGNCKGSGQCHFLKSGYCTEAAGYYDNDTVYYKYTSRTSRGNDVLGYGCAAMYKCVDDKDFGPGLTGKELKEAFGIIYSKGPHGGNCGKCGSHTLENSRCWVTFNLCKGCVDSNGGAGVPLSVVCPPLDLASTAFLPWATGNGSGSTKVATDLWGANPSNLALKTVAVTADLPATTSQPPSNTLAPPGASTTSRSSSVTASSGGIVGNGPIVASSVTAVA